MCEGVVVGKQFRVVEWDIQNSPRQPDGACVTINTRATQLNPKGLRTEIAKMYRLDSSKQVKQFRHCYMFGTIIFYEQLDSPQAISKLDEGGVIVWTRVSPQQPAIALATSAAAQIQRPAGPVHEHAVVHSHWLLSCCLTDVRGACRCRRPH